MNWESKNSWIAGMILGAMTTVGSVSGQNPENPEVILTDLGYHPTPSPCCESCQASIDGGDASKCAELPSCGDAEGSVFFSVGLGRTWFKRDRSFASALGKASKDMHFTTSAPRDIREIAGFYRLAPLTARRSFQLWYHQDALTDDSFKPEALTADPSAEAERIAIGNAIRQILTQDRFVDIQPLADVYSDLPSDITTEIGTGVPGMVVRTWLAGDQGSKQDGLYGLPSGNPLGYVIYYRDTETSTSKTLGIIRRAKVAASTYKTESWTHFNNDDGDWTSIHFSGLPSSNVKLRRVTREVTSRTSTNAFVQTRTVEEATLTGGGTLGSLVEVERDEEVFDDIGGLKRLVKRTKGMNLAVADRRITEYGWIDTPSNTTTHGLLQWRVNPDKSFEHNTYNFSSGANSGTITVRQPWEGTTWTPGGSAPPDSGCVVETITIAGEAMTTEKRVDGTALISWEKEDWTNTSGFSVHEHEVRYGANTSDVLTTQTAYYSDTSASHLAGRIAWRVLSDGSTEKYSYTAPGTNGAYTQTIERGAGNSSGVTSGIRLISTRNKQGFTTSESRTWFDSSAAHQLSYWTTDSVPYGTGSLSDFDFFGRPQGRVYNSDPDDYEATIYGCCGISFRRNRMGVINEYSYDDLKRLYEDKETAGSSVVKTSIAQTTDTGFVGRVTEVRRSGGSGGGALDLLNRKTWVRTTGETEKAETADQDGDTNPEEISYTYSYPSGGGRTVTVTRPDSTTEASTYLVDGRIETYKENAVVIQTFAYDLHSEKGGGIVTKTTRLTSTNGTSEWVKTYSDLAGRNFKTEYPTEINTSGTKDHSETVYFLHTDAAGSRGKPEKSIDPDGVTATYAYNAEGERVKVTETLPNSAGNRVSETLRDAVNDGSMGKCERTITKLNGITVSTTLQAGDGYDSRVTSFGRESKTHRAVAVDCVWFEIDTNPDGSRTVRKFEDGRLDAIEQHDSSSTGSPGVLISSVEYGYDALGRTISSTDSRTGTTNYTSLTEAGNVLSMTEPGSRTTAFAYDRMGRVISVNRPNTSDPNGAPNNTDFQNVTHTSYWASGQVKAVWGDQTYPTFHIYDEQERLIGLHTWQNDSSLDLSDGASTTELTASSTTTWSYSTTRGWLDNKRDDEVKGADYTYTAAGRLRTRTWARTGTGSNRVKTTYGYDQGMLETVTYTNDPASTPNLAYTYDAFGRIDTVTQANQSHIAYAYDATTLVLDTETISYDFDHDGTADFTRVLDRSQDSLLRPNGWQLKNGGTPEHAASYGYDTAGRLKHVHPGYPLPTSPSTPDFTYNYESESYNLVETLTSPAHTVTNTWETTRDILSLKENEVGSTLISSYSYGVNEIGQRETVDVDGTAFSGGQRDRSWTYDDFGQLETEADANNTAYNRGFAYDAIGNRTASIAGDTDPTEPGAISYTPDSVNQYSAIGSFSPSHDDDGNAEDWQIRTGGLGTTTLSSAIFIWDAENRLIEIQDSSENTIVQYTYDSQSRRIRRKIDGGADIAYFYDGWNPIAEYDLSGTPSLIVSNLWGLDSSGSMQGAGGVGGLLSVTSASGSYYPTYDGNGNVSEYLEVTTEDDPETPSVDERVVETSAHYEYDAFGNVVNFTESTAGLASTFRHRFSTKQQDDESGLLYYGFRYYDPLTGRWPSRDPIGERGGVNLYGFVFNCPLSFFDWLGGRPIQIDVNSEWFRRLPDDLKRRLIHEVLGRDLEGGPIQGQDIFEDIVSTLGWGADMEDSDSNQEIVRERLDLLSRCKEVEELGEKIDEVVFGPGDGLVYYDLEPNPLQKLFDSFSLLITAATGSDPISVAADFASAGSGPDIGEGYRIRVEYFEASIFRICCEGTEQETKDLVRKTRQVKLSKVPAIPKM